MSDTYEVTSKGFFGKNESGDFVELPIGYQFQSDDIHTMLDSKIKKIEKSLEVGIDEDKPVKPKK